MQGIGLRLQDQQGQALELNQRSRPYILQPGSNTLWFSASVESTQRAVMAAGFAAVAHIQVIYREARERDENSTDQTRLPLAIALAAPPPGPTATSRRTAGRNSSISI